MDDRTPPRLARRTALRRTADIGLGAAVAWLASTPAAAQARLAKDAVKHVDHGDVPGKDCDDCRHDIAPAKAGGPASCRLVEGAISRTGTASRSRRRAARRPGQGTRSPSSAASAFSRRSVGNGAMRPHAADRAAAALLALARAMP